MSLPREPRGQSDRKADTIRRLQVGITGLLLVMLLVGLSTLLTSESRQAAEMSGTGSVATGSAAGQAAPDDPLTDLGVEPVATDPSSVAPEPTTDEVRPPVGPLVPDLEPDPQLDRAPTR